LRFADLLTDAGSDHVNTNDWAVVLANQLDKAGSSKNLALSVSTKVVFVG
jgi:hypothetical protein